MGEWYKTLLEDSGPLASWAPRFFEESRAEAAEESRPALVQAPDAVWPWPLNCPSIPDLPDAFLEECRRLRTALRQRRPAVQMVLLTAPEAGAGVTTLARNLAAVCATPPDQSCLLIDASGGASGAVTEGAGLTDLLAAEAPWERVLHRAVNAPRLCWIDAGSTAAPLSDLLAGPEWKWLCAEARLSFDLVLIDGAPLGDGAAADQLMEDADTVVVVARTDWTRHPRLAASLSRVPKEKFAGLVLNG